MARLTYDTVEAYAEYHGIHCQRLHSGTQRYECWLHDSNVSECRTLHELMQEINSFIEEKKREQSSEFPPIAA